MRRDADQVNPAGAGLRAVPTPLVLHEPMPPQQQDPVLIIDQDHHRRAVQPHHVMPEPLTVWEFDIDLAEPHPGVVVDRPLTKRPPLARPITRIGHSIDANAFGCGSFTVTGSIKR